MEITEVRIKLMDDGSDRLKAFCSITFDDCFVIRDLKIIDGTSGPFVAMPSRKLTAHCPSCRYKNHLRAGYCNQCGKRLSDERMVKDEDGRAKLYADIAHPINSGCREMIQARVIEAFEEEMSLAQKPGYISRYDDYEFDTPEAPAAIPRGEVPPRHEKPASSPAADSSRFEPAEPQRPGPHRPEANKPARSAGRDTTDSFGEGIL